MIEQVIAGAVVVERLTEIVKKMLPEKVGAFKNGLYVSATLGIFVSIVFRLDFLVEMGLTTDIPLVGEIFTGLFMTGGAALFHELIKPRVKEEVVIYDTED